MSRKSYTDWLKALTKRTITECGDPLRIIPNQELQAMYDSGSTITTAAMNVRREYYKSKVSK